MCHNNQNKRYQSHPYIAECYKKGLDRQCPHSSIFLTGTAVRPCLSKSGRKGRLLLSGMRAWAGSHHNSDTRSNVTTPQSVGAKLISSSSPQTGPPFNFMSVLSTFKFPVFWAVNPGVKKERNLGEFWNSSLPFICGQGYHLFFLTITQTHSSSPFPLPNP